MFPLALLPTISDDLAKIPARVALTYQNSFMKNAVIRGLNNIHECAHKANPTHLAFRSFMEYIEVVCDITTLHIQGDEVFCKALLSYNKSYPIPSPKNMSAATTALASLRRLASEWKKNGGKSYQPGQILSILNGLEGALVEVFYKQVPRFADSAVPGNITDAQMTQLIKENVIWLTSNSDINILLPFSIGHHDIKQSKFWPPTTPEAFVAMPELVKKFASVWAFSPFDPVTRREQKHVF